MSLQKGLVLHLPLDRASLQSATTFADKTPRENVGTKYGSVLKFDKGDDNYVNGGSAVFNVSTTDDWTMSLWEKSGNVAGALITVTTDADNYIYLKIVLDGGVSWRTAKAGDVKRRQEITDGARLLNEWNNVVVSKTGDSDIAIYINGILNTTRQSQASDSVPNETDTTQIGRQAFTLLRQYLTGSIGDTRIYSRALSAAEVLTMYQGGVVDDTDLEAHYKFGDKSGTTLTDETANNNDGTLTNFADTTAEYGNTHDSGWVTDDTPNVFALDKMGQSLRSLSFDGESDYLNCGNDASLQLNTFTWSVWFKSSNVITEHYVIGKASQNRNFGVRDSKLFVWSGVGFGNTTLQNNVWYHSVYVYNGTQGTLYLNGVEDKSATSATLGVDTNNLRIGDFGNDSSRFDGSLADVRIYNRALSQQEITLLAESYRPKILLQSQYGVSWDESANTYDRTGTTKRFSCSSTPGNSYLPIHADMRRCVVSDGGVVQYYLDPTDSTKKADGTASDLTGGDGQVMVEIPKFYYKQSYSGTTHTWEIARGPIAGFSLHPAFMKDGSEVNHRYFGAYEGSMWDATTSAMVPSGSITSDMYASGDKLCSISAEYPKTNEMRSEFRTMASERGAGWRQLDFDLNSAVQLLYIVEYADFDSQTEIGYGRTQLSGGSWVAGSYIGQCGKSNGDGDGTNSVAGDTNDAYMTYRGIENWYGNVWKWNDGININDHVPYVTNNASAWADDTATGYTDLGVTLPAANNYQITLADTDRGFLPASVGASTTYVSDYYWQNTGWRVVVLGGSAYYGASAGAFYLYATYAASDYNVAVGGRLCR